MSNAEKEYQDELKQMTKEELLETIEHFRNLSFDLQYKLDKANGRCTKCNCPLETYCWYCNPDLHKEVKKTKEKQ